MPEVAKTMTVRWPGEDVDAVRERLLTELNRLAQSRWGFLGYASSVRPAPTWC